MYAGSTRRHGRVSLASVDEFVMALFLPEAIPAESSLQPRLVLHVASELTLFALRNPIAIHEQIDSVEILVFLELLSASL